MKKTTLFRSLDQNHGFCSREDLGIVFEQNAIKVMINSGGTRASKDQVKQLAAMRGLVVDPLGNIVEMPTKIEL